MRQVQVHVSLEVDDDVTDEMIKSWLPSVWAQVEEPVYTGDESGNDGEFTASNVMLDLYIDGKPAQTVP